MFHRFLQFSCILLAVFMPRFVLAAPVLNEVMWMGTDQSSSDEWIELFNPDDEPADLSGWVVTSLNSKGEEALIVRFATGTMLEAGQYLVIANAHATTSRLLDEPGIVTTAMSLPNTKLLLRLRDASSNLVDSADDGVGSPFAGLNPSGGVKASMERIDLALPGDAAASWATATLSIGFDEGAKTLGTPGYQNSTAIPPDIGSSSSESSASSSSSMPACSDPLTLQIYVQDGALRAVGKTTVNFQALAASGSLTGVICSWVFSDGYTSQSCNPPAHAFDTAGEFTVHLEAKNQCGNTLAQELFVIVDPDPASAASVSHSSSAGPVYDGARIILTSALPNPESTDTNHEWFELRNLEDRAVDLSAWKIGVGETSVQRYALKGTIEPRQRLKIYNSELKFTLSNADSKLRLFDPLGNERSSVDWPKAEEARVYLSNDLGNLELVSGTVVNILDTTTILLSVSGQVSELLDEEFVTVRLLGVLTPDPEKYPEEYYKSLEFIRALIENKKIELEFDTIIWDKDGVLLAYVVTENSLLLQKELLTLGFVSADDSLHHSRQDEFSALQKTAVQKGIGVWNLMYEKIQGALNQEIKSGLSSSKPPLKKSTVKTSKKVTPKKVPAAVKKIQGFAALYRADIEKENDVLTLDPTEAVTASTKSGYLGLFLCFLFSTGFSLFLQKMIAKYA